MELGILINVLVTLLIFGLVFWGINRIAASIPGIPGFVFVIIQVLVVILLVFYLLKILGLLTGVAFIH